MGGATYIDKAKGIKKVLKKTESGSVWVVEKLRTPPKPKKRVPVPALIGPERLRVADVLALLKVSRSTLYAGLAAGRYPLADGKDGNMPFWKASTIRQFLER